MKNGEVSAYMSGLKPFKDTISVQKFGRIDLPALKTGVNGGVCPTKASHLGTCTSLAKITSRSTRSFGPHSSWA